MANAASHYLLLLWLVLPSRDVARLSIGFLQFALRKRGKIAGWLLHSVGCYLSSRCIPRIVNEDRDPNFKDCVHSRSTFFPEGCSFYTRASRKRFVKSIILREIWNGLRTTSETACALCTPKKLERSGDERAAVQIPDHTLIIAAMMWKKNPRHFSSLSHPHFLLLRTRLFSQAVGEERKEEMAKGEKKVF